jgi:ribose transport system substrate-binding protein
MKMRTRVRWLGVLIALGMSVGIAACGGSGGSSSGGGTPTASSAVLAASTNPLPSSGCGSLPPAKTLDPDGAVATLPKSYQPAYAGYEPQTFKSAWADWKPDHAPPYKIGIQWNALTTPFQADMTQRLKAGIEKLPGVGDVILTTTGNNIDVGQGLQAFGSMLNQGVDLIVTEPLTGGAYIPSVKRAQKAGVPVVSVLGPIDDPAAVNVDYNAYTASAESFARVAQMIGGKGTYLYGGGIAGTGPDVNGQKGVEAAVSRCPGIKKAGEIYSGFISSVAKGETLKFLATHPQKVDMIYTTGPFVPGIMQAFQQTGRPIPPAIDNGGTKGMLGYWEDNRSYPAIGVGVSAPGYASAVVDVVGHMLKGEGPKVSNIVTIAPSITASNLDDWAEPGWTLQTPGQPDGPPNSLMTPEYVAGLMNVPAS